MQNRRTIEYEGHALQVAPPEYVIVRKLEFYREGRSEKHLHDIRGMLRHSRDQVDFERLERMIADKGLGPEWELAGGTGPA